MLDDKSSESSSVTHIGTAIRDARVAARVTVEQVSATTKIRAGLIREIEEGEFRGCGGVVYARGHIRSICAYLGVDADPLVAQFEAAFGVPEERPVPNKLLASDPVALSEFKERTGTRWLVPGIAAMAVIVVVAGMGLANSSKPAGKPLDSGSQVRAQSVSPSPTVTSPSRVAAPDHNLLAFAGIDLKLLIKGGRSWISIVDSTNKTLFEGVLDDGSAKEFKSSGPIKGVLGNARVVDLTVNGKHLGVPDSQGTVFSFTFTPGDPNLSSSG